MKLLILGTAGYHPNESRHTACLVLPEVGVVLDAGTAMFRLSDVIATDSLDIFLTHAHVDHVIGLTYLLDILHQRPLDQVRVHGELAKLRAIREHLFSAALFPVEPPYESIPLAAKVELPGGGCVRHCQLKHPGGSVGYRLDWPDHSLAYITDTTAGPDAEYLRMVEGVDLLVHECNFPDSKADLAQLTGHSCPTPVANVAKTAGVGALVLTHFNPSMTEQDSVDLQTAREIFPNTRLATDQTEVEF